MSLKKLKVTNFKSFNKAEMQFGSFNVVIGANAAGKSNFIQIFQFIKEVISSGLDNAISMQGGINYLRNMNIGASKDFSVTAVFDQEMSWTGKVNNKLEKIKMHELIYEFALNFKQKSIDYAISKDRLHLRCEFFKVTKTRIGTYNDEKLGDGEIIISSRQGKINVIMHKPAHSHLDADHIFASFLREEQLPPHTLLAETSFFSAPLIRETFNGVSIYNINPRLPKAAIPITGKAMLEEDAGNLAIILKKILKNSETRRKFFNLLAELLPFVDNLDIEERPDKSLFFKVKEKYFSSQFLPAFLLSDGTINATALIITLYFEKQPITIIEEPERNVHPYLMSRLVNMMKDASSAKQIIITTHNPEVIKYATLEDVILIARDKNGFSSITRPHNRKEIRAFIKNEIGLEELFVQNLLEG